MQTTVRRRDLLGLAAVAWYDVSTAAPSEGIALRTTPEAEAWLDKALLTRGLDSPLSMSRFVEPMYYLKAPFTWTPNPDNGPSYVPVTVPTGFVTDLASIPPPLFPFLRADGTYAQAAILHDFLYWSQIVSREKANEIFKVAMRDLEVRPAVVFTLYEGVSMLGAWAWNDNIKLKQKGEKRILKTFPTAASTRWSDWKQRSGVFTDL